MKLDVALLDNQIKTLCEIKRDRLGNTNETDVLEGVINFLEDISVIVGDNYGEDIDITITPENSEAIKADFDKIESILYDQYRNTGKLQYLGYNARFINASFVVTSKFNDVKSKFNTLEEVVTYIALKIVYRD